MEALAGLFTGGASLLGTLFTNNQNQQNTQQNNIWNLLMAQQQQAYQTQMSNTQYQRGVADMKAAGLNPALMFGSGGPAPSPSAASVDFQKPQVENPGAAIGSAMQAVKLLKELEKTDQEISNLKKSEDNTAADTQNKIALNPKIGHETNTAFQESQRAYHERNLAEQRARDAKNKTDDYENWGNNDPAVSVERPLKRGWKKSQEVTPEEGKAASERTNKKLDKYATAFRKYASPEPSEDPSSAKSVSPYGGLSRDKFYSGAADDGSAHRLFTNRRDVPTPTYRRYPNRSGDGYLN